MINNIREGISNPRLILRQINRGFHTRLGYKDYNSDAANIFELDWDNLIILDACRYDEFSEQISDFDIPGKLKCKQSLDSATKGVLRASVDGMDLSDMVYLTATSMLHRESVQESNINPMFHKVIDVWKDNIEYGKGGVPPSSVTDSVLEASELYDNKKIVAHYIQPHTPFIGEYGQSQFGEGEHAMWRKKLCGDTTLSDQTIQKAYRENLKLVLEEVERLISNISGKTVITSDHGQAIGDRAYPIPYKEYGHPSKMFIDELIKIPYYECTFDSRREVEKGDKSQNYSEEGQDASHRALEQLEGLGYL